MLPPPALTDEGHPPEAKIERARMLVADLYHVPLLEFTLDLVKPILSALNALLRSGIVSTQPFAVRASLLQ